VTEIIDLSKPTGYFEVAVFHHDDGKYEVCEDRGFGSCAVYESGSQDKAVGVAEYCESMGRYSPDTADPNAGEPYTGSIWHWSCSCSGTDT
jgi:hypothetical protein